MVTTRRRFLPRQPYLVAAVDDSHGGRLALARRLVTLAAEAGAGAVKFALTETRPDTAGSALPDAAWAELRRTARGRIDFVLAPYDEASLARARRLQPDVYQIDPPVLPDRELVARIGRQGRPVLVVAGACTTATLDAALRRLPRRRVAVLHTIASAAPQPERARLQYVPWLAKRYKVPAGYLSTEAGLGWTLVAASLGARVIEKPFTLDRALPGTLRASSLEPAELASLAAGLRDLAMALGAVGDRRVFAEELAAIELAGRSLVARRPLRRGAVLRARDLVSRPSASGVSPGLAGWLAGRRLRYDVEAGEPITLGLVETE
jgi:sialic acid synthase SpsE